MLMKQHIIYNQSLIDSRMKAQISPSTMHTPYHISLHFPLSIITFFFSSLTSKPHTYPLSSSFHINFPSLNFSYKIPPLIILKISLTTVTTHNFIHNHLLFIFLSSNYYNEFENDTNNSQNWLKLKPLYL